jgi:uncharacterized protein
MSALNVQSPHSSLDEERRAHEPSMEEILASIRRMIADEDSVAASRREKTESQNPSAAEPNEASASATSAAEPTLGQDIEEAAGEVHEAGKTYAQDADEAALDHAAYIEPADESEMEPARADHDSEQDQPMEEPSDPYSDDENATPLVSPDAAASIAAQFQTLAATMLIKDSGLLDDYARELLKPMLKSWLDDNLPALVERLVRAEIERVARGGARR